MKKIDWGMIFGLLLIALLLVAMFVIEIRTDIDIITSDSIPFLVKWRLILG